MAKLLSGTRIYGTATVDTFLIVSGTATSTSTTTGAITVAGGAGIGGALYVNTTSYIFGAQILTTATVNNFVSGVSSLTAGTDTRVSTSTGAVTFWNTSTLQSVTNRGWTTTNVINITNSTAASTIASGALIVSGGVGVAGTVYASQLWGANQAGAASSNIDIRAGNGNWNISFLARAGAGNYNPVVQADDSLLYWTTGSQGTGNLVLAPWSSTATGVRITNTGSVFIPSFNSATSTSSGALVVQGGVGIWGNLWVGGTINGTASTATSSASAINLANGTAGQVPYQTGPSATSFFGPGTAGNVLVSNGTSAPTYNNTLILSGTTVATNTTSGALRVVGGVGVGGSVYIAGSLFATTKSFYIDHPTKPGMKLKYGSLEGPENCVYVRGKLDGRVIELPDYWTALVDPDSITVDLTPFGSFQQLFVEKIEDNKIYVSNAKMFTNKVSCFYTVWAERKDVEKLVVEAE
jgi:hypothetical protein